MPINIDADPENADWMKAGSWDLPPYGSKAFNDYLRSSGMSLTHFKTLPVYKAAVMRGEIEDENKGSRHAKIIGDFGEHFVCNWLSRSGWEVLHVDHTGIDLIAFYRKSGKRIGITVKSRTRVKGTEKTSVYIFKKKSDRENLLKACEDFACKPWIAVYVEIEDFADLFLTSLDTYDAKYRKSGKAIDGWKMSDDDRSQYSDDPNVHHLRLKVDSANWDRDKQLRPDC
jgi:Holliday junction resolvase-like predicted endonuclease